MRRTSTDYKFEDETPNTHYLSTHSLKSNDNNDNIPSNLEFSYYFDRLCHIDDHHDVHHKTILSSTYESGIGSSISSIDVHCNLSSTTEESSIQGLDSEHLYSPGMCSTLYSHFDYHDLPPVTEEEDIDSILGIFNISESDNTHLDNLPWHEQSDDCGAYNYTLKRVNNTIDTFGKNSLINSNHWWDYCSSNYDENTGANSQEFNDDDHLEKPWISNNNIFTPVLSSICHRSEDCILKSDTFLTHFTNTNMISDKAMMYKVFQRRRSVQNGSSMFNYNIKSLITMDSSENDFSGDDEYIQGHFSD